MKKLFSVFLVALFSVSLVVTFASSASSAIILANYAKNTPLKKLQWATPGYYDTLYGYKGIMFSTGEMQTNFTMRVFTPALGSVYDSTTGGYSWIDQNHPAISNAYSACSWNSLVNTGDSTILVDCGQRIVGTHARAASDTSGDSIEGADAGEMDTEAPSLSGDLVVPLRSSYVREALSTLNSINFEGEKEGAQFWLAKDSNNNPCMVVTLPGGEFVSTVCTTPDIFSDSGLALRVADVHDNEVYAYAPPEEIDRKSLSSGISPVSQNIVTLDNGLRYRSKAMQTSLQMKNGKSFELISLDPPSSSPEMKVK